MKEKPVEIKKSTGTGDTNYAGKMRHRSLPQTRDLVWVLLYLVRSHSGTRLGELKPYQKTKQASPDPKSSQSRTIIWDNAL